MAFAAAWQARLVEGFPLLAAMGVTVHGDADNWRLHAPFALNRNDHGTAFGASISSLATIAGWMAANALAQRPVDVVIQRGDTAFLRPIAADLQAWVIAPEASQVERLQQTLQRKRPARIALDVAVAATGSNEIAARFSGVYVAVVLG